MEHARSPRIAGFDVARAFAIYGMTFVNFGVVLADPTADGPRWPAIVAKGLEGRAAATFVVLAGIGLALMAARAHDTHDHARVRATILRRAALLFVVGLAYMPLWPADILHYYGVYLVVGAVTVRWRSRALWAGAVASVGAFVALALTFDYERGWDWATLSYSGFWTPGGFARDLLFNGFHPAVPWTAFLLYGIWLGRRDWGDARVVRRIAASAFTVAVFAEAAAAVAEHAIAARSPDVDGALIHALVGTAPMPPMPMYMLAGGAWATAFIAACVGLTRRWAPAALVSTGQLALTLYVAHVVVGMLVPVAVRGERAYSAAFTAAHALAFCVVATVLAYAWRRRFTRGPLEGLMRRLSG
ncbi:DUF1624 domain-containing protein [Candidatus Poribacteria bacterium]|jgi:uncharacterized protein|nr:DUF1624 domain-containing protein [Candidatus Poribacteria bacterium]MBT5533883.1 DUF1624 domain-containing protein [Candidatus Poribacteria bacterium]MBT7809639.1 DUF1624 domain-containing protein [Candidatus Poribacteria bacterium]